MRDAYPRATRLVRSGRIDAGSLVTARFPLEQAGRAFQVAAARTGLKVAVLPGPPS